MTVEIYIDGSSNGLDSCICIITIGGSIKKSLRKQVLTLERKEIQFVEYLALIDALKFIIEPDNSFSKKEEKIIYTDSLQVFKEVNLLKICSPLTLDLLKEVITLLEQINNIKIVKINRENNLAGIYLDKRLEKVYNNLNYLVHRRK